MERTTETVPQYRVIVTPFETRKVRVEVYGVAGRLAHNNIFSLPVTYLDIWRSLNTFLEEMDKSYIESIVFTYEEWQQIRVGSRINYNAPHRGEQAQRVYEFSGYLTCVHCGTNLRCRGGNTGYNYYSPSSLLFQKFQRLVHQEQLQERQQLVPPSASRHPGPANPQHGIPAMEWPNVVRRVVDNQEPLRQVAKDYGVSYETIRRTVRAAQKSQQTG